mmetsp:Transcript_65792/g.182306  ORF Transcript_65792/g.182306 Transcript_65792/m.182306 type:complete len:201 (+) Transcript_65792:491-1093(+)
MACTLRGLGDRGLCADGGLGAVLWEDHLDVWTAGKFEAHALWVWGARDQFHGRLHRVAHLAIDHQELVAFLDPLLPVTHMVSLIQGVLCVVGEGTASLSHLLYYHAISRSCIAQLQAQGQAQRHVKPYRTADALALPRPRRGTPRHAASNPSEDHELRRAEGRAAAVAHEAGGSSFAWQRHQRLMPAAGWSPGQHQCRRA